MNFYLVSDAERGHLAGVWDSDGSISIVRTKWKTNSSGYKYVPHVSLTWRKTPESEAFLYALKDRFGGHVHEWKSNGFVNRSPTLMYSADFKNAVRLLEDIKPFLRIKKRQAELCIELGNRQKVGRNLSPEIWAEYETLRQKVRLLNSKKGKAVN